MVQTGFGAQYLLYQNYFALKCFFTNFASSFLNVLFGSGCWGRGKEGGGEGSNSPKNNSTHPSLIVGYYTY